MLLAEDLDIYEPPNLKASARLTSFCILQNKTSFKNNIQQSTKSLIYINPVFALFFV